MEPVGVCELQVDAPRRLEGTVEASLDRMLWRSLLEFIAEQGSTLQAHAQSLTVQIGMLVNARVGLGHNFCREERHVRLLGRGEAVVVRQYGAATRFALFRVNGWLFASDVNLAIPWTPQRVQRVDVGLIQLNSPPDWKIRWLLSYRH